MRFSNGHRQTFWMVLTRLGYHVGYSSLLSVEKRREILSFVFEADLGNVPKNLTKGYGRDGSAQRLRKIAYTVASFVKSAKKKSFMDYSQAIDDWESDLLYLHEKYYVNLFGFKWPE